MRSLPGSQRSIEAPPGLPLRTLAVLGLLGAGARLFNLGTFSLWLDEILLVGRASGSVADVWRACLANAEHPPLSALVSALVLRATPSEIALRLVHVAAGLAAALLLSEWVARTFGRRAGLAAGLVFALSPFAVRYAQEVRPYPFLLLAVGWTLVWLERGRRGRAGWGWTGGLALAMTVGLYSHYLYPLALVPAAWVLAGAALAGGADERAAARRLAGRSVVAAAGAAILFLPWIGAVGTAASRTPAAGVADWSADYLLRRLHFLTVGGKEGEAVTAGGILCIALVAAGCAAALRRRAGRSTLAGALVGIAGVEAGLLALDHWSNARYDLVGWVFLIALLGLGSERLAAWGAGALGPAWRRPLYAAVAALTAAACLAGLLRYDRTGRPDWDRVAAAVAALRRPGEVVLAENEWTRISLGHYLRPGTAIGAQEVLPVTIGPLTIGRSPEAALARWPAGRCALLVTSGYPRVRPLRAFATTRPRLASFPASEARIVLLGPRDRAVLGPLITVGTAARGRGGPCPDAERRLPAELRGPRLGRVDRIRRPRPAAARPP